MTDEQKLELRKRFEEATAKFMTPERQAEGRRIYFKDIEKDSREHQRILAKSWALAHTKHVGVCA